MVVTKDYYSLILTLLCMKLKLKMFMKILVRIKKCSILVLIQAKSKYYDDSKEIN